MTATRAAVASCCLAFSACQTTTDPTTGRTVMSVPSLAQILGVRSGQTTGVPAGEQSVIGQPMRYVAAVPGRTTHLTLTRESPTSWLVAADMTQPDCLGDVKATATETSPGVLTFDRDAEGNECRIRISETPEAASIGELLCIPDHGGACEFAADLRRTN